MLHLPTIALISIDVAHPFTALASLVESARWTHFHSILLFTDVRRHPGIASAANDRSIRVIHHTQSDQTTTLPGIDRTFYSAYERAHMVEPLAHLDQCSHALYQEPDAGLLNPEAWNPFWLSYDYIGAPWPIHTDPGFPPCDGCTNAVGNSGFSLRSRRFYRAVSDALLIHPDDPTWVSSDSWMCRTMRPWLEKVHDIQFAPVPVAARFSCENRIYTGQFGYHGATTARVNGWQWPPTRLHAPATTTTHRLHQL